MPAVAHDERPSLIDWARTELAIAAAVLELHSPAGYGLCLCGRVWECDVYAKWSAYATYWRARQAEMERAGAGPTMLLPVVAAR